MKRQLEIGDIIKVQGITATIASIAFQEPWSWRKSYYLEFTDTNGVYRSWKQEFDGGNAYSKDGKPIEDVDGVQTWLDWGKSQYDGWYVNFINSNGEYDGKHFDTRLDLRNWVMGEGGNLTSIAHVDN